MTLFAKTIPYTYESNLGAFSNKGRWVDGTPGSSSFQGSVQPMSGKEIDALGIGRVDGGYVKVYSDTQIPVSEKGGKEKGAIITWNGRKWEAVQELGFQNGIIPHYKYVAQYTGKA